MIHQNLSRLTRFAAVGICLACAPLFFGGCLLTQPATWEVESSGLDFIQMTFVPDRHLDPARTRRVTRLELLGNGYLAYERGSVNRVEDGFWRNREDPNWHDLTRDYVVLSKKDALYCFQSLVDTEFFGPEFNRTQAEAGPHDLLIYARIGRRTNVSYTSHARLTRLYRKLLKRLE